MNIHWIKPEIKKYQQSNVPPLPRQALGKTEFGFHLTPVHPINKGFFGLIITHKVKYQNSGQEVIEGSVYFNYDNDGAKPTMRELFALASAGLVIFENLVKQQIGTDAPSLDKLVQKEHVDSINTCITQAYPLN